MANLEVNLLYFLLNFESRLSRVRLCNHKYVKGQYISIRRSLLTKYELVLHDIKRSFWLLQVYFYAVSSVTLPEPNIIIICTNVASTTSTLICISLGSCIFSKLVFSAFIFRLNQWYTFYHLQYQFLSSQLCFTYLFDELVIVRLHFNLSRIHCPNESHAFSL
jgi:hypothetical protein